MAQATAQRRRREAAAPLVEQPDRRQGAHQAAERVRVGVDQGRQRRRRLRPVGQAVGEAQLDRDMDRPADLEAVDQRPQVGRAHGSAR